MSMLNFEAGSLLGRQAGAESSAFYCVHPQQLPFKEGMKNCDSVFFLKRNNNVDGQCGR